MCTVAWWRGEDGAYSVFFNRDESRARPASEAVAEQATAAGMRFLAPRDPLAGGSWLMANAAGIAVGVLNHYSAAVRPPAHPVRSRGELPLIFGDCRDGSDVAAKIPELGPTSYAPFLLLAWDPESVAGWSWDGDVFAAMDPVVAPVTTSSYRTDEVGAWRRHRYAELVRTGTAEELTAFQDDVGHPDPAFNVRMRRPDARTESVCRIDVTRNRVVFQHCREDPEALRARDEYTAITSRT